MNNMYRYCVLLNQHVPLFIYCVHVHTGFSVFYMMLAGQVGHFRTHEVNAPLSWLVVVTFQFDKESELVYVRSRPRVMVCSMM